ncbi:MAG: efflux RND transporter periplasmic adaptor subunit [Planctomycetes bacterium]|nr:efflux RND transporter periplasmic adaptor subunit [Planctomycetota bacterium]
MTAAFRRFQSLLSAPMAPAASAALLGIVACGPFGGRTTDAPASKPAAASRPADALPTTAERIRVRTQKLQRDAIASYLETTAHIEALREADVFPKVGGIVRELRVEEGDSVRAGDTLAVLDQTEARIALKQAEVAHAEAKRAVDEAQLALDESRSKVAQAKVDAEQAKRDYERDANLGESKDETGLRILAPKVVEASKLAWDRAENARALSEFAVRRAELAFAAAQTGLLKGEWGVKLAQVRLDDTEVKATIPGVISARTIKHGDTATAASKMFHITDLENLQVNFFRPQRDLRILGDGVQREVIATSEAITDASTGEPRSFLGRVERVAPTVDPQSGSFKVTVSLKNSDGALRPGLLVRVRVTLGKRDAAYLLPKRARVLEGEKPCVFVVRDGKTVRIPIVEGYSDEARFEVRNVGESGIRPDDDVVVVANVDLKDGLSVTQESTAAAPVER